MAGRNGDLGESAVLPQVPEARALQRARGRPGQMRRTPQVTVLSAILRSGGAGITLVIGLDATATVIDGDPRPTI